MSMAFTFTDLEWHFKEMKTSGEDLCSAFPKFFLYVKVVCVIREASQ